MPRPDGSDSSSRISVAPPRGATGKLNRAGYAVLGVSGLVVATAFAAIAELAGPGISATAGGTGIPGGQGTSPAGVQLVPGNAVPGSPMTVSGSPVPGSPSSSSTPPSTITSIGPDGKETTSVVIPPPPPPPNPGPGAPPPHTGLPPTTPKPTPTPTPTPTSSAPPSSPPPSSPGEGGGGASSSGAPNDPPGSSSISSGATTSGPQ